MRTIRPIIVLISTFFILFTSASYIFACHEECTCIGGWVRDWPGGVCGGEWSDYCRYTCDCDYFYPPECCGTICDKLRCCPGGLECEWVDCCDNSCNGSCSPTCPAGQSTTVSGPLCRQALSSCSYSNDCGNSCTYTGAYCYLPETNTTALSQPSSVSITVGQSTYNLSLDESNPTRIKMPADGETVTVTIPTVTTPTTSRGRGYYFKAFEYSTEIFASTDPTPTNNQENTQNFTTAQLLDENETGKISGMYYTVDKCDNTYLYSTPVEGYFVIDDVPDDTTDDENGDGVIDKYDYLPDLGTDITPQGCTTDDYTGQDINNPLHFYMEFTDNNGNDEMESLILWFSTDTSTPILVDTAGSQTGIDMNDFGLMIKKDGNWSNPTIYGSNEDYSWAPVTDGYIINTSGDNAMHVFDINITQDTEVHFDFKVEFLQSTTPITDNYHIYASALDTFMFSGTTIDMSMLENIFDFNFDLINPTVEGVENNITSVTDVTISWSANDLDSGIDRSIINAYVLGGGYPVYLDALEVDPISTPSEDQIGLWTDTQALQLVLPDEDVDMYIGQNETGSIDTYITTYDLACNYNRGTELIEFSPWVATKGGIVYSKEGAHSEANDVSDVEELDGAFVNFTRDEISSGTEVLASRSNYIYTLIHPELGSVSASSIYDANNQKSYWFNYLTDKLNSIKSTLTELETYDEACADYCYFQTENDITIPETFTCTGKTVFVTEGSIDIEPNDVQNDENTGCIYIAKNDINIGSGTYKSGTSIAYDYLEGFFIAENQINIEATDTAETIRDGLEIKGSLTALGRDGIDTDALSINRSVKLYNLIYPTVLVNYDTRYSKYSEMLIGKEAQTYKQEIGFKAY